MNRVERPEQEILAEEQEEDLAAREAASLEAYLTGVPEALHQVVRRHGVGVFHLCYTGQVVSGALAALQDTLNLAIATMAQAPSKRPIARQVQREGEKALRVIGQVFEGLGQGQVALLGLDPGKIPACQEDIKLVAQLASGGLVQH